ncbi:MAG TPA: N-acetyl-gamma-glutamyl-phosphate reductase [Syntrophales bacterium]|jgi:N-acetyl-gamma-glutamyl-phosphate reductase|nr:N-acetyl-gamma-glutamyl-phosphate reductase [Syntrophales bacterium]
MMKVGIYGASGYTGQELLRLLLRHPGITVAAVTSRRYRGKAVAELYPVFADLTDLVFMDATPEAFAELAEVVFLALPHGVSMSVAPGFLAAGCKVIDLSADFRLREASVYEQWYAPHLAADTLPAAVYGLPELYRDAIRRTVLTANPGCYPTSIILGLAPLLKAGWLKTDTIIADAKSGVSGAGREPVVTSLFCEVDGGFKAYKVGGQHRHTPEIEQELTALAGEAIRISFTPHLLPLNRGILSTLYGTLNRDASAADVKALYDAFYERERFVRICRPGSFPNLAAVRGSNHCDIGVTVDERTGRVIVVSVIDNLVKGAAGQAVQNMNLMCGFEEAAGLEMLPLFP